MLIPEQACGSGYIIPYTADLVPAYHQWFKTWPELLELTASEPLTLEEEIANQVSWETDTSKLTGIICDSDRRPVGDVNVFFDLETGTGELNVMIADPGARRKGLASGAVRVAMAEARRIFSISNFQAKIDENNTSSQELFTRLGFREVRRVAVFKEVHFEL